MLRDRQTLGFCDFETKKAVLDGKTSTRVLAQEGGKVRAMEPSGQAVWGQQTPFAQMKPVGHLKFGEIFVLIHSVSRSETEEAGCSWKTLF